MKGHESLPVFIGYDSRESFASYVCAHSIKRRSSIPVSIRYLNHREQRARGNFRRPWRVDSESGEMVDLIDNKTFSTEFSHTRFLTPYLMGYKGWALTLDADMICLGDIARLLAFRDERYAAVCVKHVYPLPAVLGGVAVIPPAVVPR